MRRSIRPPPPSPAVKKQSNHKDTKSLSKVFLGVFVPLWRVCPDPVAHAEISRLTLEIGALVDPNRVRRPKAAEASACETVVEPESAEEVGEIVRKCERDRITLAPIGAARTLANMRRFPAALGLSLTRMARVVAYEPDDMTVVAQAGITLAALNDRMGSHRQRLPLDPPRPESIALGAMIGASKAGPLRLSEGLVRDLLIGIQFVGHGGRIVRAGGRVVKNVAGYDLMKVMTGSFGTLGIVTEAAFKVRPIPERYALALACYDQPADAFRAGAELHDALPLSHLEVASADLSRSFGARGNFLILAGFSGNGPEVDHQRGMIARILGGRAEFLDGAAATQAFERLRDLQFPDGAMAAQLTVLPAELGAMPRRMRRGVSRSCRMRRRANLVAPARRGTSRQRRHAMVPARGERSRECAPPLRAAGDSRPAARLRRAQPGRVEADAPAQGELRSGGDLQSRMLHGRDLMADACACSSHARSRRRRLRTAVRLRALRTLPRGVPNLPADARRDGLAARAVST